MSSVTASAPIETPLERLRARLRAPEWLALTAIALIDAVWANRIGFHLHLSWHDVLMPAIVVAVTLVLHLFDLRRASIAAEYLALSLTMAIVFTVFCYLAFAS